MVRAFRKRTFDGSRVSCLSRCFVNFVDLRVKRFDPSFPDVPQLCVCSHCNFLKGFTICQTFNEYFLLFIMWMKNVHELALILLENLYVH